MSKQFEQFELLYRQVLVLSLDIKNLIDLQDYNEIIFKESQKAHLISKISQIKPSLNLSEEETSAINILKTKILEQEKENLDRMQVLKAETFVELKKEIEKEKITNKYEQVEYETGSLCDYVSD